MPQPCPRLSACLSLRLSLLQVMYRFLSEFTGLPEEQVEMECGEPLPGSCPVCRVGCPPIAGGDRQVWAGLAKEQGDAEMDCV